MTAETTNKRKHYPWEKRLHKAVCRYLAHEYPCVIFFSEPSGLRVSIGQAVELKALRTWGKLPDLFIAEPRNGYAGLFIEIKTGRDQVYLKSGQLRKIEHIHEQARMIARLEKKGYRATFGCGFVEIKGIIDEYLK